MFSRSLRIALVMACALVLGQWLALLHASEHSPSHPESLHCSLCLQAHSLGHTAVMAKLSIVLPAAQFIFAANTATRHHTRQLYAVNNRGPPRFVQI